MSIDIALLLLRLVLGLVFIGHGGQKLFGWFGGSGLTAFGNGLAKSGVWPASVWALLGGVAEFGGGILYLLGFLNPLGAMGISAAMLVAIITVHWTKGFWNSKSGIEFPLVNLTVAVAVALAGPGAYSLDAILGTILPEPTAFIAGYALVILGLIARLVTAKPHPAVATLPKTA